MKGILLGVMLACASGSLCAEGLLCTGTTRLPDGTKVNDSRVLKIDFETLVVSVATLRGEATGTLIRTDKNYGGLAVSPDHYTYSLTMDRYSGDIWLMGEADPIKGVQKVEFWGTCARATPKF